MARHWLGLSAIFNLVYGFGAIVSPHVAHDHYMSSGWISILLGVLQLVVGAEAVMRNQLARWLGVALLALNVVNQGFFYWCLPVLVLADHLVRLGLDIRARPLRLPREPGSF